MHIKTILTAVVTSLLFISCGTGEPKEKQEGLSPTEQAYATDWYNKTKTMFGALPEAADPTTVKAQLGKKLYYETALSINNTMSCNSCHMLDQYGVDNLPTSPGHDGTLGERNSPTVYNASFHIAQFWDGRAADLKEQAKGPILNPIEMGIPDEATAVQRIADIPEYSEMFSAAFPEEEAPISYENIAGAIAEFEKCLNTPSRFDEFMNGNVEALSQEEIKGMETFVSAGCITCHMGPGLGGKMYQKFGLVQGPYWVYTGSEKHDRGRAEVTGNESDEFFFKVPSLRNVAKTAPYLHDGSVASLEEVIKIMGITQLGKELTSEEIASIETFLNSLTGDIPEYALNKKELVSN